MRTLILGCKGQLGRDLMNVFADSGAVEGRDLPELDIASRDQVAAVIDDFKPDIVINAAAYTDVDGAEDDWDGAYRTNALGARITARAACEANIPIVYYSTDFVFDGRKTGPYVEDDPVAPVSAYGRSKAEGEQAVREENPRHFIIRTAWLYGPKGNCFPDKIIRRAGKHPELKVVEDEIGSPTHTWDLAEATRALVNTVSYGVYHGVNSGHCSRFDLAKEVLRLAGIDIPVRPCAAKEFPTKAERPRFSVLSTEKLTRNSGYTFRKWEDALAHYMERRRKQEISKR